MQEEGALFSKNKSTTPAMNQRPVSERRSSENSEYVNPEMRETLGFHNESNTVHTICSLLQIVTCECATARVGGARPSTIDAWQCFLFDIHEYKGVTFVVLLSFPLSLPFDWTLRC